MAFHPLFTPPTSLNTDKDVEFQLFHDPVGLRSMAVRLMVAETGEDVDMVAVRRFASDDNVAEINASKVPLQRLPALLVSGSNTLPLYDVAQIAEALCKSAGKDGLLPTDASEVALLWNLQQLIDNVLHPALEQLEFGHPTPQDARALREQLAEGFRSMAETLGDKTELGDKLTVVDAMVAPYLLAGLRIRPELDGMPWRLLRYGVQLADHPAVKEDARWVTKGFMAHATNPREKFLELSPAIPPSVVAHQPKCVVRRSQVFDATATDGPALYTCFQDEIFNGTTTMGSPVATVSDGHVYAGGIDTGTVIAKVAHGRIYTTDDDTRPIAMLHGGTDCEAAAVAYVLMSVEPQLCWEK